jgi:voltage-gated sodium channel
MVNFICNAVEAELNPEPGTKGAEILAQFDLAFIIIFTAELAVNIFANWMQDFVTDAWCWFDTIVVVISLVSKFASDNAGLSVLRTVRAFRVFRLFKKLKSLRQIIRAINYSLPAVINAFFLVILMTMIYAIMGTTFIRFADPENFSAFSVSMYTMWRIMTFDNAAGITLDIMENVNGYDKLLVALFVVSYQLMVAFILCNIVMAVLLEEFSSASEASKSEDAEERIALLAQRTISALDPLLHELSQVDTEAALSKQIQELFKFIDEDNSCAVDFTELRSGLRRLDTDPPIDYKVAFCAREEAQACVWCTCAYREHMHVCAHGYTPLTCNYISICPRVVTRVRGNMW